MFERRVGNASPEITAKPGIFIKGKIAESSVAMHGNHTQNLR